MANIHHLRWKQLSRNILNVQFISHFEFYRLENAPKSRYEAYVDDLTAEEVLEQVQCAAKKARKKLSARKNASKMGFLRQARDGSTSMQILIDSENLCPERVVSVGAYTGKLAHGTGQLQGFREDRRNSVKLVKPLNYGTFCSFAPIYDSRFANLNKEESDIVLNTYGECSDSAQCDENIWNYMNSFYWFNPMQATTLAPNTRRAYSNSVVTVNRPTR